MSNSLLKNNLSDKESQELEGQIKHSLLADKLREHYLKKLESLRASERSESQFDKPNWDYKQAYKNGSLKEITELLKLLGE